MTKTATVEVSVTAKAESGHTTIHIDRGDAEQTVVVFDADPGDVTVESGTVADPSVMVGPIPDCVTESEQR